MKFKNIDMNKIFKNIWLLMGFVIIASLAVSCDDDTDPHAGTKVIVDKIYLQDAESSVPDREVDFVRLGQTIRVEGSGFLGMRRIYVNGYETYFNPVLLSDNSMLLQVSGKTPTVEAEEDERNTIRFVKASTETTHNFLVRDAAPSISSISHTMPLAGEEITIFGSGLIEINKVVFPGDIEVTEGIESDEKGKFIVVTVPAGITESGSLFVVGANGAAYSPAYFNFKEGLILDFDGNGAHDFWGDGESMIQDTDLLSDVIGDVNVSQGTYVAHRPERVETFSQAANRRSEVWASPADWRSDYAGIISPDKPVTELAFQFDIYVPEPWANTGILKVLLINNYNGGEWAGYTYNYIPWLENKEVVPFQTEGWTTVTIPFNKMYAFSDPKEGETFTFDNILVAREEATYSHFGFFFDNPDFTLADVTGSSSDEDVEFESSPFKGQVYTDNWRIVPLDKPVYSDFPDEEDEVSEDEESDE